MVELIGKVTESFKYSHELYGEDFYTVRIDVVRTSGYHDEIVLMCSDRVINTDYDITDRVIGVTGDIRTYNDNGHVVVNVYVTDMNLLDCEDTCGENIVELEGYLCKKLDTPRKTPGGRKINDTILAVNRSYGRSDYVPVIAWGKNADYITTLPIGTKLKITGRMQSRNYEKDNTIHTVYEVSSQTLEVCDENV